MNFGTLFELMMFFLSKDGSGATHQFTATVPQL